MMDELMCSIQEDVHWCMLFVYGIVLIDKAQDGVNAIGGLETNFEIERVQVEQDQNKVFKVQIFSNASYETSEKVTQTILRREKFKYLESVIQGNGNINNDVAHHTRTIWMKLRLTSRFLCDKKVPSRLKGKLYKVVRLFLLYEVEC